MSFQFFKNGVEITAPRRIKWRFVGHSQVFESNPEKLDINANFWRRKLDIPAETGIQIYEEGFEIQSKEEKQNGTNSELPTHNAADIPSGPGPDFKPSVSETLESSDDTNKRKTRRKTSELSDVSPLVDNTDSSSDE